MVGELDRASREVDCTARVAGTSAEGQVEHDSASFLAIVGEEVLQQPAGPGPDARVDSWLGRRFIDCVDSRYEAVDDATERLVVLSFFFQGTQEYINPALAHRGINNIKHDVHIVWGQGDVVELPIQSKLQQAPQVIRLERRTYRLIEEALVPWRQAHTSSSTRAGIRCT